LIRWFTALFLFSLPLLICPWNTGYSYTKSAFALAAISFLLLLWSISLLRKEGQALDLHLPGLFYPGLAVLAVAALSLFSALSPGIGLQSLALLIYFFLFYLFLANTAMSERELHLFLGSIVASASLASGYGILQYYGVLPGAPGVPKGTGAIISTFGNKNYLGGFLACLVLPSLILLLRARHRALRALSLLALGTIIYTLVLVDSTGAWLAVGASGAFFLGGFLYFRLYRALRFKGWLMIIGAASVILLMGLLPLSSSPTSEANLPLETSPVEEAQVSLRSEGHWGTSGLAIPVLDQLIKLWERNSGRIRAWDWWIGWEMLKAHPLLGVGLGHYKVLFLEYKAKFLATERGKHYDFYILRAGQAHNEYVQAAAELGALGILAGGFLLFMLFFSGFKTLKRAEAGERFIALALLSGVVASLTDGLFSFPFHLPASALAFVLLLGLLDSRFLTRQARKRIKLTRRGAWLAALALLALVAATGAFGVRDFLADVHLQRGKLMLALGDDRAAEEELRRSLALDFQPQSNLFYLGGLYAKQGRYEESLALFQRSLNCYALETTYWYLGTLNLALGNYDAALAYLAELVAIDPSPQLKRQLPGPLGRLYDHAVGLLKAGRDEEALRWLDTLAGIKLLAREERLEADYFRGDDPDRSGPARGRDRHPREVDRRGAFFLAGLHRPGAGLSAFGQTGRGGEGLH
jgi:O-antigen ligase